MGDDFNDMLLRDGPEAVAALVRAGATRQEPPEGEQVTPVGRHLPISFRNPGQQVPQLRADEGDLKRAASTGPGPCCRARTPRLWLFRAGGLPSWLVPDDEGRPTVATLNDERLRHMLALVGAPGRSGPGRETLSRPHHPPGW